MQATFTQLREYSAELPADQQAELASFILERLKASKGTTAGSLWARVLEPMVLPVLATIGPVSGYLSAMLQRGQLSEETYSRVTGAWMLVMTACRDLGSLPPAGAAVGEDGSVLLTWDREEHHFEIEVPPAVGPLECFYAHRGTDESWADELEVGASAPPVMTDYLGRLARG